MVAVSVFVVASMVCIGELDFSSRQITRCSLVVAIYARFSIRMFSVKTGVWMVKTLEASG